MYTLLKRIGLIMIMIPLLMTGCSFFEKDTPSKHESTDINSLNDNSNINDVSDRTEKEEPTKISPHLMGEVEIVGTPERVVVLEYPFIDVLIALETVPVGIADDSKGDQRIVEAFRDKLIGYKSVGKRRNLNLEVIDYLNPDLIIGEFSQHKEFYDELKGIAPTIILKTPKTYNESMNNFTQIADVLGKKEVAQNRIAEHQSKFNELKQNVSNLGEVTVLPAEVTGGAFRAYSSKTYIGELLEMIGLTNAIQDDDRGNIELTLTELAQINPDYLLIMHKDNKTIFQEWENQLAWKNLKAVQNENVHEIDYNLWTRYKGVVTDEMKLETAVELITSNNN